MLRCLSDTETSNGFGNRFLWALVKRSKLLPDGGSLPNSDVAALQTKLAKALSLARRCGEVAKDAEAAELWHTVYPQLTEERDGLAAALTSRAEAQVMRLALLYALLDCSATITRPHLEAALALWDYCEQSAYSIFGDALGDPNADRIIDALKSEPAGLNRTQIYNLFGGHTRAPVIDRALGVIEAAGIASHRTSDTGGRPIEIWRMNLAK